MAGRYWDEFSEGDTFVTKGRTITETDILNFAGLSGDFNPLHTDEEFAKKTVFGKRIAHGLLGLAVSSGLSQGLALTEGTLLAFLGLEWKFAGPVFIGDTVHAEQTVSHLRATSNPKRGILTFDCKLINQDGKVVQEGKRTLMIERKVDE